MKRHTKRLERRKIREIKESIASIPPALLKAFAELQQMEGVTTDVTYGHFRTNSPNGKG